MKKVILLLLFFLTFCFGSTIAQFSQWEKAIGGANFDEAISLVQTSDGGYAIAGTTQSYGKGGYDVYIAKLNSVGTLQWTKTVGGINTDVGFSIIQSRDKGYAISGYTNSFTSGYYEAYIIKLDSTGNLKWTKTVGGTLDPHEYAYSIIQTKDGGFVGAGSGIENGSQGAYYFKLDSLGNLKWTKILGVVPANPSLNELFYSATNTFDGGFAFAGYANGWGYGYVNYCYVVKTDSLGNVKWASSIGGTSGNYAHSIKQTNDTGYIVAGYTSSYGSGGNDVYIIKLDASGNLKWTRTVGGSGDDLGWSVVQTNDRGYLVAGYTNSYGTGGYDVYLIRLDSAGTLLWTKTIGGTSDDYGYALIKTKDGGFALSGRTNSYGNGNGDVFFVKLDVFGNSCLSKSAGGNSSTGGTLSSGWNILSFGASGSGGDTSSGGNKVDICSNSPCSFNVSVSSFSVSCFGGSNGKAIARVTGGSPPYTFRWSPGGSTTDSSVGLKAGNDTVFVKDSNGCIGYAFATIVQPNKLQDSINSTCATCCNCLGTTHIYVWGGTQPYTYLWNNGRTYDTLQGLASATYTCVVTDANGCTLTDTIFVHKGAHATTSSGSVSCYGASDGSATVTVSGNYSYSWSPGGQTGATATGLSAGTYCVQISSNDTSNCLTSYCVAVTQPAQLLVSATASNIPCNGGTGSATANVSGGTPSYNYSWTPTGGNGATANGLSAGTYTVSVTDSKGCTASTSIMITQPLPLTVSIPLQSPNCSGMYYGSAIVTGGTPPYVYSWNPNVSNNSSFSLFLNCSYNNLLMNPFLLQVFVTDANGCTANTSQNFYVPPGIDNTYSSTTNVSCYGGNSGSITVQVCGGNNSGNYYYIYPPGNNYYSFNNPYTFTNLAAGTYSVSVNDGTCSSGAFTFTITQPPAISITSTVTPASFCGGNNGSITTNVTNGVSPYTYSWSNGATTGNTSGLTVGTYTLHVTDHNGCTASATATITQPTALNVNTVADSNVKCKSGSDGMAHATVSGGTSPFTYLWSGGHGTNSSATGFSAGTYTVSITDKNGCTGSSIVSISEPSLLKDSISKAIICFGDTATLNDLSSGGVSPYSYLWSAGGTLNSITVSPLNTTKYFLTVTDSNGCVALDSSLVKVNPLPHITLIAQSPDTICNTAGVITLFGSPSGGTYSGKGVKGNFFYPDSAIVGVFNLFYYSYTDSNGCSSVASDSLLVEVCTGVNQFKNWNANFVIYPNPNNGTFSVNLIGDKGIFNIEIFNVLGEKIMSETLYSTKNILNLSDKPDGVYFYKVSSEVKGVIGFGKMIIEK